MKYYFSRSNSNGYLEMAAKHTGGGRFMEDAVPLAVFKQPTGEHPQIVLIVVFQNINEAGAEIHFVTFVKNWATQRLLTSLFTFAFKYGHHSMLRAPILADRTDIQIAALKAGFRFDGRLRSGALGGKDAILMTMKNDECRWTLPPETTESPLV